MKGLLLKDYYMILKYCRAYLFIFIFFIPMSALGKINFVFLFYPCFFASVIPITLLGYDERSKWNEYSETFPYTRQQIVSSKYIIGLIIQVCIISLSLLAQIIRMYIVGSIDWNSILILLCTFLILSSFSSSISLPFMFKYGVEKGRIGYYIMIGIISGGSVFANNSYTPGVEMQVSNTIIMLIVCMIAIALYMISWYLSIKFYESR